MFSDKPNSVHTSVTSNCFSQEIAVWCSHNHMVFFFVGLTDTRWAATGSRFGVSRNVKTSGVTDILKVFHKQLILSITKYNKKIKKRRRSTPKWIRILTWSKYLEYLLTVITHSIHLMALSGFGIKLCVDQMKNLYRKPVHSVGFGPFGLCIGWLIREWKVI